MISLGKKTLIASAVAAALGSGAASALPPATTPTAVYYAGGGSAQANAFAVAICQLGFTNVDMYSDAGAALSGDYYVLYGTDASNVTGNGTSAAIMYIYKFNGGSYMNGLAPQVPGGGTLPFPVVGTSATAGTILGSAAATANGGLQQFCTGGSNGKPEYSYTAGNDAGDQPDFGLTDVETTLFSGYNNPTGNAGKNAQNTNGGAPPSVGAKDGIYDNLFGVAVTDNVYSGTASVGGGAKTSFSRAEVEGILAGTISDWSQLLSDSGALLPAGGIIFLDRTEGSGTKASGNEYFLGYPGDNPGAQLPFSASTGYSGPTGAQTWAAVNGSKVASLDIAEASTNTVIADLLNVNQSDITNKNGARAIAILGLENPPLANQIGGKNQYDFVKINQVAVDSGNDINASTAGSTVSYANVITGNYDFFYQNSFNTRAAPTGRALAFKNVMKANAFIGCTNSLAFPKALGGTLIDGDAVAAIAKGVTLDSREKLSTGPLQPVFTGPAPACSDPL